MTVAVSGSVLCIGNLGFMHALNTRDGKNIWSYRGDFTNGLAVTNDSVYFADGPTASGSAHLTALRLSEGKRLWRVPVPLVRFGLPGGPTVAGNIVYQGSSNLYALRASDGTRIWEFPADVTSTPVVSRDTVYFLTTKKAPGTGPGTLRASDGTQLWNSIGPQSGSLTTNGKIICGLFPYADPLLWAWRASDGTRLWKSGDFVSAVIAGDVVYAVSATSELLALRASDGTKIWGHPVNLRIAPAISEGVVYAGTSGGGLVALSASSGKLMWHSPLYFTSGPTVGGNTVYVSDDAKVYAFSA